MSWYQKSGCWDPPVSLSPIYSIVKELDLFNTTNASWDAHDTPVAHTIHIMRLGHNNNNINNNIKDKISFLKTIHCDCCCA